MLGDVNPCPTRTQTQSPVGRTLFDIDLAGTQTTLSGPTAREGEPLPHWDAKPISSGGSEPCATSTKEGPRPSFSFYFQISILLTICNTTVIKFNLNSQASTGKRTDASRLLWPQANMNPVPQNSMWLLLCPAACKVSFMGTLCTGNFGENLV